jgi:hypothetical protein
LHHHCDLPQSITLLGARGERPCGGRTGNDFDEISGVALQPPRLQAHADTS